MVFDKNDIKKYYIPCIDKWSVIRIKNSNFAGDK